MFDDVSCCILLFYFFYIYYILNSTRSYNFTYFCYYTGEAENVFSYQNNVPMFHSFFELDYCQCHYHEKGLYTYIKRKHFFRLKVFIQCQTRNDRLYSSFSNPSSSPRFHILLINFHLYFQRPTACEYETGPRD